MRWDATLAPVWVGGRLESHAGLMCNDLLQYQEQAVHRCCTGFSQAAAETTLAPMLPGALVGDREALGASVQHTIFFAGEATHPAVNPCMQFALQTGEHAAAQIIDAVYHLRLSRM